MFTKNAKAMLPSEKISVMISSRCNSNFPADTGRELSKIRKEIKQVIEGMELFGKPLYEVWINEDKAPKSGAKSIWQVCMETVDQCDILLALYNGEAGWAEHGGDIGICHAELARAMSRAPVKVRAINLGETPVKPHSAFARVNKKFREYWAPLKLFTGPPVSTEEELIEAVKASIAEATVHLVQSGVLMANRGRYHSGAALDWSHLDFKRRANAMKEAVINTIRGRGGISPAELPHKTRAKRLAKRRDVSNLLYTWVKNQQILTVCHAIPAPLTVSAAREMVGQPFLNDYLYNDYLDGRHIGPLHIIACQKGATEAQAIRMLGFPDATVVNAPFGIYVADAIQKVQFVFLANCRDESSTCEATMALFDWLEASGEIELLIKRAKARARIVEVLAQHMP